MVKKNKNNDKKKDSVDIFEQEISMLSEDYKNKLLSIKPQIVELVDLIEKVSMGKSIGFYISIEMEMKNSTPVPNFDKLTLNFLLDDYENPIGQFNPKILLGNKFDDYLEEEIKKSDDGEEYYIYRLKNNSNIKFAGTNITQVRENCFDAIYDDIQKLGSSFIFRDNRGFISALKSIDIHRNMLLQKFEKYVVVYAGAGSWLRGEKSNDFDVFIVVDDTDVKRMPRAQVKEQLSKIVWKMAGEVAQLTKIQLHCQIYLLTDFWEALKDAHPVMFTFLRDGVPFYDRGIYSAWTELLKLGKIRPSSEAIDMHMNVGTQLIDRAKKMFTEIVANDIYHAVLNPAQAILMLKGYNPTTPKETVNMFKDVLLGKEKCITKEELKTLENTVKMFKKIEHDREDTKITGADIDNMIRDADNFLKKMKKMFEEITDNKTKESILSTYSEILNQMSSLPQLNDLDEKDVFKKFETKYINTGKIPSFTKASIKSLLKAKKDYEKGNLSVTEVNKVLKEIRTVLTEIKDYKSKSLVDTYLKDKKILINYNDNKSAQLINYNDNIYLMDLEKDDLYKLNNDKFEKIQYDEKEFLDPKEYKNIKFDESLIGKVKEILKTKEIYL
ncbi:MAG: hypothetical protein ACOC16_01710 [Nanoarchaeota archaeon]